MELDLREILEFLRRKILIILVGMVLGLIVLFIISKYFITPIYTAEVTMYVYNNEDRNDTLVTVNDLTISQKLVDTYIVILKSDSVLNEVARKVDMGYSADEIRKMLSASAVSSTEVFEITISNSDPHRAQTIANTIANVAPDEIIRVVKAGDVQVIDYATLPEDPSSPNIKLNSVLGALLGIILSILMLVIIDMLDISIKDEGDLVEHFEYPIIGIIPSLNDTDKHRGYISDGE